MKQTVPESIRRLLALLLCAVMLLPNFTVLARAEEPVDGSEPTENVETIADEVPLAVIYAASDFQAEDSDGKDDLAKGKNIMASIIDAAGLEAGEVTEAFFCGDYSADYNTWKSSASAAMTAANNGSGAVAEILSTKLGLGADKVIYLQGNHDPAGFTLMDATGAHDPATGAYGVYVINEDNFPWKQGDTAANSGNEGDIKTIVKQTADDLANYLEGKLVAKDNRPIFVCAHVPLHMGWRTADSDKGGDNMYANYIFDVLNEYGKKLNIIYLFGHDHSNTYDDYLGGAAVYLTNGDKLRVPNASTSSSTEHTLNFTYMNAGYVGYYGGNIKDSDGNADTGMSSTVFEVYSDKVVVSRYDEDGATDLKNAGAKASKDTWSGAAANTKVYPSAQTIKLKTFKPEWMEDRESGVLLMGNTTNLAVSGIPGNSYNVAWTLGGETPDAVVVTPSEDGMTATVTGSKIGAATVTAIVTNTATREATVLTYEVDVISNEIIVLAEAGEQTFFVLDDNQDSNTWAADTSKRYVIVSQEKGNVTAGEFMAMYYNGQLDSTEGDAANGGTWRELNAEPITVMELPVNGEKLYAVSTSDTSYMWVFQSVNNNDKYNWYYVEPEINHGYALMLSKGHTEADLKDYDTDNDGIRLRGVPGSFSHGSTWRMSDRGAGLTTKRDTGDGYWFAPYYDSIQGDISVYYTQNGDENMGQRIYMYEETTITLENPIVAYMSGKTGSVSKGVGADAGTGSVIYIQNGEQTVTVPVTIGMLSGSFDTNAAGSYAGLTITYAGKVICEDYTLNVTEATTLLKNEGGKFRSTIYRLTEEMVGGRHYLIVDDNKAGEAHAMGAANRNGSDSSAGVTAHNVLIQSFEVGGEDGLYIDSTRYSANPDAPYSSIIVDQGDVNANIFSAAHKKAIRLVWTPSIIQSNPNSSSKKFDTVYSADKAFRLLNSEYEDGRLWINNSGRPVVFWAGSTSNKEEWTYVPTGTNSDHMQEGLVLNSSEEEKYRLFYNIENYNSDGWQNKNFLVEGNNTDYDPLTRRTWIYEQVNNIDTITARIDDLSATVTKDCNAATITGDYILVETYLTDGTVELVKVPVRVSMLSGAKLDTTKVGTYSGLTVTYEGKVITNNYTLTVKDPSFNDYPEFPDEGAVKINKKADTTTYSYLKTGVATIDLSVTGIPSQSGVDIIFILDTSSSMERCIHHKKQGVKCGTCGEVDQTNSRLALLKETMVQTLKDLQSPINGYTPDIDVAVACFNGYTPIDTDLVMFYPNQKNGSTTITKQVAAQYSRERMDSSVVTLNFTDISKLSESDMQKAADDLYKNAGTNYDRGVEIAYNMLKAKQEESASNGETRQQILVFMSDGSPYQFNYIHGDPDVKEWNNYLLGTMDGVTTKNGPVYYGDQELFDLYYNDEGRHWLTEAIKGDPDKTYKIINPDLQDSNTKIDYVTGLGATVYTVGMGITNDNTTAAASCNHVLQYMASPSVAATDTTPAKNYFYSCTDPDDFRNAFSEITDTVRSAGDAVFTDQLGSHFDLVTANIGRHIEIDPETGAEILIDAKYETAPFIEVKEYELYKRSEIGKIVNGVKVTEEMVGTRKPVAPKVVEKITFNDNGTVITSTLKSGNILDGDIIKASTFFYNTNKSDTINIDPDGDGVADVALLPETFYWNIGDVPQNELVLTYCVYLEDSMQGNQVSGTYNTNEFAKLNYVNYLGHDCELEVPSPKLPWNQGTVGYAFYLVDRYGRPIINQTSGETGSFAQSVRITNPVYEDFMLNNDEDGNVNAEIVAKVVLPNGYSLFDESAVYNVTLLSTGAGSYHVMGDTSLTRTTYVEGVADVATLPEFNVVNTENFVTSNTVVWFAVVADVSAIPDTVVIDYGLPVDIHVLANDTMLGDNGKLTYVGDTSAFAEGYNAAKANNSDLELWQYLQGLIAEPTAKLDSTTVNGNYGVAAMQYTDGKANGLVRYTLNQTNGMQMDREEVFVYAVNYNGGIGTHGYYYSTLTVIPATTIYYEDSFVTLSVYDYSNMSKPLGLNAGETDAAVIEATKAKMWQPVGETDSDATQAEDRPGEFSISNIDANNIYGYDQAYANADKYSLGSAQKVTVGTHADGSETFAIAEFRFTGTGFDVISLTSNMTGTITVDVIKPENFDKDSYMATAEKSFIVDTYYGYTYGDSNGDGKNEWYVNDKAADSLYQVPVMQVNDLPYGTYHVVITAAFADEFAHSDNTTYDFYLDAIRVYDSANDGNGNEVIEDAYVADKEGWPEYHELRNLLISSQDFDQLNEEDQINGIIFIDGNGALDGTAKVADYQNYGPNNELYLAPGQAVSFVLGKDIPAATLEKIAAVSLGMKSVGGSAEVKIYNARAVNASLANTAETVVGTATDMYYDISEMIGKTVVIYNSGEKDDAILSLTNIKITYKTQPKEAAIQAPVEVNKQAVNVAMASFTVQSAPEEEVPEIPEIPETTAPTEPSEPDPFEPEVSVKLSKDSVKTGTKITVTVTTSGDVDSVVINGVEVNSFKTDRRTQKRTWTTKLSWNEAGEQNVTVTARNEEGAESEPVVKTVTVTGKSGNNGGSGSGFGGFGGFGGFDWMTDLLGRLFGRG